MNIREGREAVSRMHELIARAAEGDYRGITRMVRAMSDRQREHLITEMARALIAPVPLPGGAPGEVTSDRRQIAARERYDSAAWAALARPVDPGEKR